MNKAKLGQKPCFGLGCTPTLIHREEGMRVTICSSLFTSFISAEAFPDLALTEYPNGFG
jgi:hypothetical protein